MKKSDKKVLVVPLVFAVFFLFILVAVSFALTVNVIDQAGVNNCNNCELIGITPESNTLKIVVKSGSVLPPPPVEPPPPPDPSCTLLPVAGVRNVSIWAYSSHCYYLTIPDSVASAGIFATMGSMDWKTNQDLLIKKGSKPTQADYLATYSPGAKGSGSVYWFLYTSESNETLMPSKVGPGTYYFYVYNRGAINTGADLTGRYELKANWYEIPVTPPRVR